MVFVSQQIVAEVHFQSEEEETFCLKSTATSYGWLGTGGSGVGGGTYVLRITQQDIATKTIKRQDGH